MIEFRKLTHEDRQKFMEYLPYCQGKGCEYSFANLCMWGRQRVAFLDGFLVLFSQFDSLSVYPFPLGQGDIKHVLDAIIHDAQTRGIPCRLSSMTEAECNIVESLYPGQFRFHTDRDTFDYVYNIEDLATLRGKRFQSKRNFANRFRIQHPDCQALPLNETTVEAAKELVAKWLESKQEADPMLDTSLEQIALNRAFSRREELGLEGLVLMENGQALAMTMGSFLSPDTFDIHFEKALDGVDGAYAAINQSFAQYLQEKYPQIRYLDREDDLGIEGLRKAKLSYHPDHLVTKYWARLWEETDEN